MDYEPSGPFLNISALKLDTKSDHGTSFVGAELQELVELLELQKTYVDVSQFYSSQMMIVWKFIPVHAPHFSDHGKLQSRP